MKFLLLGAVLSGIMIVLNLRASATDLVRRPVVAILLGMVVGFSVAATILAKPWRRSDE